MKGRSKHNTGGVAAKNEAPKVIYAGEGSETAKAAVKRKRGGKTMHKAEGEDAKMHAGRKPRKSGGRLAGNDWASAQRGTAPKGRKLEMN